MPQSLTFEQWKEALVRVYMDGADFSEAMARQHIEGFDDDTLQEYYSFYEFTPEQAFWDDVENWEPDIEE